MLLTLLFSSVEIKVENLWKWFFTHTHTYTHRNIVHQHTHYIGVVAVGCFGRFMSKMLFTHICSFAQLAQAIYACDLFDYAESQSL